MFRNIPDGLTLLLFVKNAGKDLSVTVERRDLYVKTVGNIQEEKAQNRE